jgi:hypothetical protein
MFGFQAATCLSFLGCAKRSHTQSEAQPRTEAQETAEEMMQGGTKEYQLKWTTDPKTWKHSGESQSGYPMAAWHHKKFARSSNISTTTKRTLTFS